MNNETSAGPSNCASCGAASRPGAASCENCGASLAPAAGQQPPATQAPPTPPPAMPPPGMPPMPPGPGAVTPPPGYAPPMVVHHTGMGNNGLCVAALVLGIISVVFLWVPFFGILLGIMAVVFGAVGIPASAKKGQMGRGLGIAGLVLGIIAVAANIVFIIIVWGIFSTTNYYYNPGLIIRPAWACLGLLV